MENCVCAVREKDTMRLWFWSVGHHRLSRIDICTSRTSTYFAISTNKLILFINNGRFHFYDFICNKVRLQATSLCFVQELIRLFICINGKQCKSSRAEKNVISKNENISEKVINFFEISFVVLQQRLSA